MDNIKWQTLLLQTDMYEWLEKKRKKMELMSLLRF